MESKFIVADIMSRDLVSVSTEMSLKDAAKIMIEEGVSSVMVTENEKIVGIITDRDYTRAALISNDFGKTKVKELMSKKLISVAPKEPLQAAAENIRKHNIRHLLVSSKKDEYIGVVSVRDVLGTLVEEIREQNKKLKMKIDELEKFYRVAIDRELVMVKLKKRIRELEKKHGEEGDVTELFLE